MDINSFIKGELIVVVPVLIYLGTILKTSQYIQNKHIPIVLACCSILICGLYLASTMDIASPDEIAMFLFSAITQGCITGLVSCGGYEAFKHLKR
jgi:hypothetical protein